MLVIMAPGATREQVQGVVGFVEGKGLKVHLSQGEETTVIGLIGDVRSLSPEQLSAMDGVDRAVRIMQPFKLASREASATKSTMPVPVNGRPGIAPVVFGGNEIPIIAGPCTVEDLDTTVKTAQAVAAGGAVMLRGGAFKPRTSPYSFQGLGKLGLEILAEARARTGLLVVTEVMSPGDVDLVAEYSDMLQIGARNMQNFHLLLEAGRQPKPVMLKRGLSASIEEWLMAAEYVLSAGNPRVILCERGIRTFETATRFTLDISAVPVTKKLSHLPVIVDPSHAAGHRDLVAALSRAALAAGADGLMMEVHPQPEKALADGQQSLRPEEFPRLMGELARVAEVMGRKLAGPLARPAVAEAAVAEAASAAGGAGMSVAGGAGAASAVAGGDVAGNLS